MLTNTTVIRKLPPPDEVNLKNAESLQYIIDTAGSENHLCAMLNITPQRLNCWKNNKKISNRMIERIISHPDFAHLTAYDLRIDYLPTIVRLRKKVCENKQ